MSCIAMRKLWANSPNSNAYNVAVQQKRTGLQGPFFFAYHRVVVITNVEVHRGGMLWGFGLFFTLGKEAGA